MKINVPHPFRHSKKDPTAGPAAVPPPGRMRTFMLKTVFMLPLVLFALWLIHLVYFPSPEARKSEESARAAAGEVGVFRNILERGPAPAWTHFHMTDEETHQAEPFQPLCITCHGSLPHSKEKKLRSILNFHTGYMACTVCHVRKEPGDQDLFFTWVDRKTGMMSSSVEGAFGKYPAKIFPVRIAADGKQNILHPVDEKAAAEFLELKDRFTPDQMAQAKIKLHERITKKPVLCKECHQKNGYFDFAKVGYPRNRIDHLISSEVVGMIDKYETFYIPEAIDFGKK